MSCGRKQAALRLGNSWAQLLGARHMLREVADFFETETTEIGIPYNTYTHLSNLLSKTRIFTRFLCIRLLRSRTVAFM